MYRERFPEQETLCEERIGGSLLQAVLRPLQHYYVFAWMYSYCYLDEQSQQQTRNYSQWQWELEEASRLAAAVCRGELTAYSALLDWMQEHTAEVLRPAFCNGWSQSTVTAMLLNLLEYETSVLTRN